MKKTILLLFWVASVVISGAIGYYYVLIEEATIDHYTAQSYRDVSSQLDTARKFLRLRILADSDFEALNFLATSKNRELFVKYDNWTATPIGLVKFGDSSKQIIEYCFSDMNMNYKTNLCEDDNLIEKNKEEGEQ